MSGPSFKIFVVDDDPVAQMIAADQLDDPRYEVRLLDSGEQCLVAMGEAPDLILMDVEMPGMDGIATCRALREAGHTEVQVIFVSAHDDLDTRLAGYDAGGNDFIVKPYAPEELARRVRAAQLGIEQRRQYAEQLQYAQQSAFTALSYLGEQGTLIQFLRSSFDCTTPEQLAEALFAALAQYGLEGIAQMREAGGAQHFSSKGPCTPLEQSIVGHARGMDRIFQFRDRLAINYPHLTLLVTNLPMHDPDRVGRLRDHLAILAEGAESRLNALETEHRRLAQAEGILRAVADLTRVLEEIERQQRQIRISSLELASDYMVELEKAFVHLGLMDAQENTLFEMAKRTTENYSQLLDHGKTLGDRLQEVTAALQRMAAGA